MTIAVDLGRKATKPTNLTFQVFERGLESEPVGREILFGVGGG